MSNHFIDQQGFEWWMILTNGDRILPISAVFDMFFVAVSFKPALPLSALGGSLPPYAAHTFSLLIERKKSLYVVTMR